MSKILIGREKEELIVALCLFEWTSKEGQRDRGINTIFSCWKLINSCRRRPNNREELIEKSSCCEPRKHTLDCLSNLSAPIDSILFKEKNRICRVILKVIKLRIPQRCREILIAHGRNFSVPVWLTSKKEGEEDKQNPGSPWTSNLYLSKHYT